MMKALLLRAGIDKGSGGSLGPIFTDGTFEYIPIPDEYATSETRTYSTTIGRHGKPFSSYLSPRCVDNLLHFDPEFDTYTYGDGGMKGKALMKLVEGDQICLSSMLD
jgi:hypothetical protein